MMSMGLSGSDMPSPTKTNSHQKCVRETVYMSVSAVLILSVVVAGLLAIPIR